MGIPNRSQADRSCKKVERGIRASSLPSHRSGQSLSLASSSPFSKEQRRSKSRPPGLDNFALTADFSSAAINPFGSRREITRFSISIAPPSLKNFWSFTALRWEPRRSNPFAGSGSSWAYRRASSYLAVPAQPRIPFRIRDTSCGTVVRVCRCVSQRLL